MTQPSKVSRVTLRLPATSANLGPGFDAVALALQLFLEIDAQPAVHFSIQAAGRNRNICGGLTRNLLLQTYESVLTAEKKPLAPLALRMHNGIPVGMGCGSSAAVRLAGVALASAFGALGWSPAKIVEHAAQLEGHPDNVAACWHGGLTIAAGAEELAVLSIAPPVHWRALLVLPETPVATAKARSMLPASYRRQDVVVNLQSVALLTAAFALGRADLMRLATRDRLHQPYRSQLCPLLPALLELAGTHGVLSVTLSGAGPAVLLLTGSGADSPTDDRTNNRTDNRNADDALREAILQRTRQICPVEIVSAQLCPVGEAMVRQE